MKTIWTFTACTALLACTGWGQTQTELKKRIDDLEARVARLEAAAGAQNARATKEDIAAQERANAKARMRKDMQVYSRDDLMKIEKLYQTANKDWRSEAGKKSLEELVSKYGKANRTGCALLYLGQMTQGDERVHYLTTAIEQFGDCYYGDGVQVGAYARLYLAMQYKKDGNTPKAKALFEEIKTRYPNAIDHRGKLLADILAHEAE